MAIQRKQQGLTLIELMIASTISLILIAGLFKLLLGHKQAFGFQVAESRILNRSRLLTSVVTESLHKSGYWGDLDFPRYMAADKGIHFGGYQGVFETNQFIYARSGLPAVAAETNDEVWIRYTGSNDGSIYNCVGSSIAEDSVAVEHYFVAQASDLSWSFYCETTVLAFDPGTGKITTVLKPKTKQPLAMAAERFRLLVAEERNGQLQYLSPDQVGDWTAIRFVRVAFVLSSPSGTREQQPVIQIFGANQKVPADGHRRHVFSSAVALKNS